MSIGNKFTYAYIKNIKHWMECPVCHEKMTLKKKEKAWVCDSCSYTITEKDFLDDFVLWFCDECGACINAQNGFDHHSDKHICRKCGYENDTTFENVKGMCIDCGKVLENQDANLCDDCKQVRKHKAKEWLIKAGKVVGIVAAVGVAYLSSQAADGDASLDYLSMPDGDDGSDHNRDFGFINDTWMDSDSEDELCSVEDEMRSALDGMDYNSDEYLQLDIQRIDVVNAIASRFPFDLPHREHGWYLPNDD